jgi:cytoskeleton protein RodZ
MQTIGERLEEARKRKGISIREAAEATKIRGDYLHKFESNQYDINLPVLYVRGFLRSYAKYLRLPADKIVADYKALGLGEGRERSLSREAYGRLEIAPATTADKAATTPAAESPSAAASPRPGSRPKAAAPGAWSATLANLDRAMLIKGGALLGGALVLVLIIALVVRTLTGGDDPVVAGSPAAEVSATAQQTINLVALDTVRVKVVDETTQRELYQGTMVRGESRPFPKTGPLLLTASALENVEIEVGGRRFPTGETGHSRIRIQ